MRETHRCGRNNHCADRVRITPPPVCDQCECHAHGPGHPCSIEGGCGHLHDTTPRYVGVRIDTEAGLCGICVQHVTLAIQQLSADYTELNTLLGRAIGNGALVELVSSSRELPIPIRANIEALQAAIVHETVAWAEPVAEKLNVHWDSQKARDSRARHTLQRAVQLLGHSIPTLLALPEQTYRHHSGPELVDRDGLDGALELLHLHDLTRIAAGRNQLIHPLPAPCPNCGQLTLTRDNGVDHVECAYCHKRWTEDEYRLHTLVLVHHHRTATAA